MNDDLKILLLACMCAFFGVGWLASAEESRRLHAAAQVAGKGWTTCQADVRPRTERLDSLVRALVAPAHRDGRRGTWSAER